MRERHDRRHPKAQAKPPNWQQTLREGNAWHAFVVGILLSFPGFWYLAALDRLTKLHSSTLVEILVVIGFCIVQLALIDLPMLAFKVWPKQTPIAIENAKASASGHGNSTRSWASPIAVLLLIRGLIGLLS